MVPKPSVELAIADAFKDSHLNSVCEKLSQEVYHLFKRATLRWRLFKRQAIIEGISIRKYKRPSGTRWVEHQRQYLESHDHNLRILVAFLGQQISSHSLFHDFLLSGDIEEAKKRVLGEFKSIFDGLRKSLQSRLGPIMQEAVFSAIVSEDRLTT